MEKILNLTQHMATEDQKQAGVIDLREADRELLKKLLTFEELEDTKDMEERAKKIVMLANAFGITYKKAMIGGAPFFMKRLENKLKAYGFQPLYAFSKRQVIEKILPDGSVQKFGIFKHEGFVEV